MLTHVHVDMLNSQQHCIESLIVSPLIRSVQFMFLIVSGHLAGVSKHEVFRQHLGVQEKRLHIEARVHQVHL